MPRRRRVSAAGAAEQGLPPGPVVIDPNAVFFLPHFRTIFAMGATSVAREVKLGRLRVSKRCGRYYVLGSWILEWIANGERKGRSQDGQSSPGLNDQGDASTPLEVAQQAFLNLDEDERRRFSDWQADAPAPKAKRKKG